MAIVCRGRGVHSSVFTVLSFLNTSKNRRRSQFLLMTLGPR
jgi:hypothetical protein